MRVTIHQFTSTATYTGKPGDVLDLPKAEADRLIGVGIATPVEPEPAKSERVDRRRRAARGDSEASDTATGPEPQP
jgi:hypothetical protein